MWQFLIRSTVLFAFRSQFLQTSQLLLFCHFYTWHFWECESPNIDMNHLYSKRGSNLLRVGLKAWEALSLTFRGNDKKPCNTMSHSVNTKRQFNLCFYHLWLLRVKNAIFTMGRDVSKQKCKAGRSRRVEKFYITLRCHTSLDIGCIMFCGLTFETVCVLCNTLPYWLLFSFIFSF